MQVKRDYYQCGDNEIMVLANKPDRHVEVWWKAMDCDGNVFPVELQMSYQGTLKLINRLRKALSDLDKSF